LPEEPIIICRGLQVSYGREPVLGGVDFTIGKGDFLPLVGPNGAGKTTLLRALLGLVRLNAGSIKTPFAQEPPGYVPQHGVIDPMFPVPVWQIVAMGLYPKLGWRRRIGRDGRQAVAGVLQRLGLADHGHKGFAELSGGMRQKALIARALVAGPQVLILDEPTAGLDQESQNEILTHLKRINQKDGCTIIMAHHGESMLEGIAHTVCQVQHGQITMRRQGHDR
jgi:ABC-type Mn2+/Zn2+ transport system ATPase subunit